jgi:hypothetical protein
MPLNTIPNTGLTSRGYPSDRIVTPLIINGDMSIAQRGTSFSSQSGSAYQLDRFKTLANNLGTFTISQSTTVPTGQGFAKSFKLDCTTADASPAAGDTLQFVQYIEGQNLQSLKKGTSSAEAVTVSFWVRSNKTGTYTLELYDNDNTRQISKTYTISSADTWEKKTVNFAGDTSGALGNDNGLSFAVQWWLGAGSNSTSGTLSETWTSVTTANRVSSSQVNIADSTSNEWYITGVQMEVGEFDSTTIPSFPFESFESNLRKCQRYYYKHMSGNGKNICSGNYYDSGTFYGSLFFPVPMRASPTIEMVSGTDYYRLSTANSSNNGLVDDFNVGFIAFAGDGISIGLGVNSGLSGVGGYGATMSGNNSSAELAFGSEL